MGFVVASDEGNLAMVKVDVALTANQECTIVLTGAGTRSGRTGSNRRNERQAILLTKYNSTGLVQEAAPPWRSLVGRGLDGRSFSSSSKRKWLSARSGTGPRRAAETKLSKGEAAAKQTSCKRRDVERNTWKVGSAVAGEGVEWERGRPPPRGN